MPSGREIDFNDSHQLKAEPPMDVTLLGMLTFSKAVHQEKHPSGISVMPSGSMTDFKDSQLSKAESPMDVTLPGMVIFSKAV